MKLKFSGKGRRKNKGVIWWRDLNGNSRRARTFFGVTTFDGYSWQNGRWVSDDVEGERSSHTPPRYVNSVRAFRRRLKDWSRYLPPGVEFILCSRFDELNVIGKTVKLE